MRRVILFFSLVSWVIAQDTYTIHIEHFSPEIDRDFLSVFEQNLKTGLASSNRIQIAGLAEIQNQNTNVYAAIPTKGFLLNISEEDAGLHFRINRIDLEDGRLLDSFSRLISFRYRKQPAYCAKLIKELILEHLPLTGKIIDIQGKRYTLNIGSKHGVKKHDIFDIYASSQPDYSQAPKICSLTVVALDENNSFLQAAEYLDVAPEYGFTAVLNRTENTQNNDCTELFFPPIFTEGSSFSLVINSFPGKAKVFLNGCSKNWHTPVKISNLKPIPLQILVSKEGYKDYTEALRPPYERIIEKSITLQQEVAKSTLTILSNPAGAEVRINDQTLGTTPLYDLPLSSGFNQITVTLFGYRPHSDLLQIKQGEHREYRVRLKRDFSIVRQEICNSSIAKKYLARALALIEKANYTTALSQLKKAYQEESDCGAIFYWKGIVEWIELNDLKKAKISLKRAQENGFVFDEETPHPVSLTPNKYKQLLYYYRQLAKR